MIRLIIAVLAVIGAIQLYLHYGEVRADVLHTINFLMPPPKQ